MPTTVAIMQPYFFPYAGYFRLFDVADVVVLLDSVQFPRRGRVHRCEVGKPSGVPDWLTLPLIKQPQNTLIRSLQFRMTARLEFDKAMSAYPWLQSPNTALGAEVSTHLNQPLNDVDHFLRQGLMVTRDGLSLPAGILNASDIPVPPLLTGTARLIAIAKALGAKRYVNLSGGRNLYQAHDFERHGLELKFLEPYQGQFQYLLPAIFNTPTADIMRDIKDQSRLVS